MTSPTLSPLYDLLNRADLLVEAHGTRIGNTQFGILGLKIGKVSIMKFDDGGMEIRYRVPDEPIRKCAYYRRDPLPAEPVSIDEALCALALQELCKHMVLDDLARTE